MTISQEVLFQAAQLVEAGVIPAEAARMLGISPPSVIKGCKEFGVDHKNAKLGRKVKFEPALTEKCKLLKRQGLYAAEIAEQINTTTEWKITETQVRGITSDVKRGKRSATKPGKFVKKRKPKPPSERNLKIFEMWCEYPESLQAVGDVFGVSRERIRQIIEDLEKKHNMVRPPKPPTMIVCAYCSVEFDKATRPGKYCSNTCARLAAGAANTKPDSKWSRQGGITLPCAECNKTFFRTNFVDTQMKRKYALEGRSAPKNRFCSPACNIKFQRRKGFEGNSNA